MVAPTSSPNAAAPAAVVVVQPTDETSANGSTTTTTPVSKKAAASPSRRRPSSSSSSSPKKTSPSKSSKSPRHKSHKKSSKSKSVATPAVESPSVNSNADDERQDEEPPRAQQQDSSHDNEKDDETRAASAASPAAAATTAAPTVVKDKAPKTESSPTRSTISTTTKPAPPAEKKEVNTAVTKNETTPAPAATAAAVTPAASAAAVTKPAPALAPTATPASSASVAAAAVVATAEQVVKAPVTEDNTSTTTPATASTTTTTTKKPKLKIPSDLKEKAAATTGANGATPQLVLKSPGRIAVAGSTDMFEDVPFITLSSEEPSHVYQLISESKWESLTKLIQSQPQLAKEWIGRANEYDMMATAGKDDDGSNNDVVMGVSSSSSSSQEGEDNEEIKNDSTDDDDDDDETKKKKKSSTTSEQTQVQRWKRLPIHQVCTSSEGKVPLSLVKVLVESYPESLSLADHMGRLPLHYAVSYGLSSQIVEYLIMEYPESLDQKDKRQRTPLLAAEFAGTMSNHYDQDNRHTVMSLLSKGADYHNKRKLELKWAIIEQERLEKLKVKHSRDIAAAKHRLLRHEEDVQSELLTLRDEATAFRSFFGDVDRMLSMSTKTKQPLSGAMTSPSSSTKSNKSTTMNKDDLLKLLTEKVEQHRDYLDDAYRSLQIKLQDKEIGIETLKEERKDIEKQLAVAFWSKNKTQTDLDDTTSRSKQLEDTIKSDVELRHNQLQEMEQLKETQQALQYQIVMLSKDLLTANEQALEAEAIRDELQEGEYAEQKATTDKAKDIADKLQTTLEEKQCQIQDLQSEMTNLSEEICDAVSTYDMLQKHITKLQRDMGPLTTELKEQKEDNSLLLEEVQHIRAEHIKLKQTMEDVLTEEQNLKTNLQTTKDQVQKIQNDKLALKEKQRDCQIQIDKKQDSKQALLEKLTELEKALRKQRSDHEEDKQLWNHEQRYELETSYKTKKQEVVELKTRKTELVQEVEDGNRRVMELGKAAEEARYQISHKIKVLELSKQQLLEKTSHMQHTHTRSMDQLRQRICELEEENHRLSMSKQEEQLHAQNAFEALEEAFKVATEEHKNLLLKQILHLHKQNVAGVLKGKGDDNMSIREENEDDDNEDDEDDMDGGSIAGGGSVTSASYIHGMFNGAGRPSPSRSSHPYLNGGGSMLTGSFPSGFGSMQMSSPARRRGGAGGVSMMDGYGTSIMGGSFSPSKAKMTTTAWSPRAQFFDGAGAAAVASIKKKGVTTEDEDQELE